MVPLEQQLKLKDQFGVGRPAPAPAPPHRHEMDGTATKETSPRMEMSHISHGGICCGGAGGGAPPAQRPGGMTR